MAGSEATPEVVANLRQQWGLDQPVYIRFLSWLGNIARGNLEHRLAAAGRGPQVPARDIAEPREVADIDRLVQPPLLTQVRHDLGRRLAAGHDQGRVTR